MTQSTTINRQMTLASRPHGAPVPANFEMKEAPVPTAGDGQMLIRTIYLSLDPYMRGRMSDAKSYADPVEIGAPMTGGTIGKVVTSNIDGFDEGDLVLSMSGWQDYLVSDGKDIMKLPPMANPSWALGILGMPGFTAYMGLLDIGKPQEGETVVVAAATGPVGATVGQIAKIKGCRAVGIAGGPEKCKHAVENLGFDACIDHYADDMAEQLAAACPDGIDVYYENVGGKVFDAVMPLFNAKARMPLCGLISAYNLTELPEGPDRMSMLARMILVKRMTVKGFIIFDDYGPEYPAFAQQMTQWLQEGKVKYKEQMVNGLDKAPEAFIGLLEGKNFGKVVIKVGDE